jgi:glycosyltransferase involved in cell wall biosynthesis
VGTGPEKARLEARASGVPGLEFRPPVAKTGIYHVLAQADAFSVSSQASSLWQLGISFNKLYDYMAMARPTVIGMDCPGSPIAEAGCGITVRPGDPAAMAEGMERLLAMGLDRRRELGRLGRAYVEAHFDMRALAARFAGTLEAALDRHAGTAAGRAYAG